MSRVVLITGVGGGIGSATAVAFRAADWSVIGVDIAEPSPYLDLDAFERVDLASEDAGESIRHLIESRGELHALVNAAGTQEAASISDTSVQGWDAVMAANARGTFLAMRAAYGWLHASGGAIVNVASVHAFATSVGATSYAASKAAIVAMTRGAALEWAPDIRVNAVLPGAIDTAMLRQGVRRWTESPDAVDSAIGELAARIPIGRIGRPDEIAQAILFLADGDVSSFITGQTLIADGGALARLSTE